MIVVDANVLVDFLAGEQSLKDSAQQLAFEDSHWISIGLWRYELGNALLKLIRRGKGLRGFTEVGEILSDAEALLVETVEKIRPVEIWTISIGSGLTYYDASYVWLAQTRGIKLRTRDKEILQRFPNLAVPMPD